MPSRLPADRNGVSLLDEANPQKIKIVKAMRTQQEDTLCRAAEGRGRRAADHGARKAPRLRSRRERETICDLKGKAAAASGLPAERLRLMYLGMLTEDHMPIAQTGLKDGCTVEHGVGAAFGRARARWPSRCASTATTASGCSSSSSLPTFTEASVVQSRCSAQLVYHPRRRPVRDAQRLDHEPSSGKSRSSTGHSV